jgi:NADH dehydrogenase/NADH:ubiquinone oxidoreductase subunit G
MMFGSDRSRFFYSKRGVEDKNCGPLVKTIMTRCIHCTRCVRFFQDVAGQGDLGTTLRGQNTEIGTYIGKNLNSELSGNIIDLCPVGALTSKPYAFAARPWEIKSVETIDIQDGVGSNIKLNFKETEILRIVPVLNDTLNEEWISDKTRFSFDGLKNQRIGSPFLLNCDITKINWRTALKTFYSQLQKVLNNNPENVLFICGNTLDLETFEKLKQVAQILGITLVTEEYLNLENDLLLSTKMNTTFSNILESDLCLTVGTNTRFEASLLNVRIKKRIRMGSFVKASIGLRDDLTYSNDSIGNSIKTLIEISEGKHFFCQQLVKAKRPFIVLGSAVKKRLDSNALSALIEKLSTYSKVVDEDWLGVNFLSSQANTVGSNLVGISQKNKIKTTDKTWKFIYCVGLNSIEKKSFFSADSLKNSFVVLQTSFAFSSLLKIKKGLLLPATTFAEKIGTFVNVEGRMQKTSAALVSPALAQDDLKIVNALFSKFCRDEILFSSVKNNLDFNSNKNTFVKNMLIPFCKETPQKIMKTPLTVLLSNFFLSNQFTKNSLIMSKCSSLFKKNYVNFL